MPAPERLSGGDACALSGRWLVRPDVMQRVVLAADRFHSETGRTVTIISGWRSAEKQRELARQGRPAAPVESSTHTSCPATGVDVQIGLAPTRVLKATWGRIVTEVGLRWGGGSAVDSGGIPSDWNHVDAGPRR